MKDQERNAAENSENEKTRQLEIAKKRLAILKKQRTKGLGTIEENITESDSFDETIAAKIAQSNYAELHYVANVMEKNEYKKLNKLTIVELEKQVF